MNALTVELPAWVDSNEVYDLYWDHRTGEWTVSAMPNGKTYESIIPF